VTDEDIITAIIEREGGFVNNVFDHGKATKFGITIGTLSKSRGYECTVADVKNLTMTEARAIYRERYINGPGFSAIANDALRALVVDCGVHHGVEGAVKLIQRACGMPKKEQDGVLGPKTHAALLKLSPHAAYIRLCAARARLFGWIITNDHTQAIFAHGWANRLAEFLDASVA
jgi:lysozyme family protein